MFLLILSPFFSFSYVYRGVSWPMRIFLIFRFPTFVCKNLHFRLFLCLTVYPSTVVVFCYQNFGKLHISVYTWAVQVSFLKFILTLLINLLSIFPFATVSPVPLSPSCRFCDNNKYFFSLSCITTLHQNNFFLITPLPLIKQFPFSTGSHFNYRILIALPTSFKKSGLVNLHLRPPPHYLLS